MFLNLHWLYWTLLKLNLLHHQVCKLKFLYCWPLSLEREYLLVHSNFLSNQCFFVDSVATSILSFFAVLWYQIYLFHLKIQLLDSWSSTDYDCYLPNPYSLGWYSFYFCNHEFLISVTFEALIAYVLFPFLFQGWLCHAFLSRILSRSLRCVLGEK